MGLYLRLQTDFSTTTMSKLSKDENVSMDVLEKICSVLNCDVGDIMDHSCPYIASLTREPFLFYEMRYRNSCR